MSYRPERLDQINTFYADVPITVKGVVFYPYVPATQIDPPEAPFVEWDSVWIGGIDVSEIFAGKYLYERLEETLLDELEE